MHLDQDYWRLLFQGLEDKIQGSQDLKIGVSFPRPLLLLEKLMGWEFRL